MDRFENKILRSGTFIVRQRSKEEMTELRKRMFGLKKLEEEKEREEELKKQKFIEMTIKCPCGSMRLHKNEACMMCGYRNR